MSTEKLNEENISNEQLQSLLDNVGEQARQDAFKKGVSIVYTDEKGDFVSESPQGDIDVIIPAEKANDANHSEDDISISFINALDNLVDPITKKSDNWTERMANFKKEFPTFIERDAYYNQEYPKQFKNKK